MGEESEVWEEIREALRQLAEQGKRLVQQGERLIEQGETQTSPDIALLEAWAEVADKLSAMQDKIAEEAYLGTATTRPVRMLLAVVSVVALAFSVAVALGKTCETTRLVAMGMSGLFLAVAGFMCWTLAPDLRHWLRRRR